MNRYAFEKSNPYRYTDSTGHYGEDVHQDITYELAREVGYSKDEANQIADADQSVDKGSTSPFVLYVFNKEKLKSIHFESREKAESGVKKSMKNSLDDFGKALHTYQDSYSHEGLDADSHIKGTLKSKETDPDNTQANPEKTKSMKENTKKLLDERRNSKDYAGQKGNVWAKIERRNGKVEYSRIRGI